MTAAKVAEAGVRHDAPSAYKMEQAMSALLAVRQRLLQDDPDLADDERLLADMLEGEGGDAMDVLHRVLRASVAAKDMAAAAEARAVEIALRRDRYKHRHEALRGAAFAAMDALGLKKLELPDLTASIAVGRPSVVIVDEAAIPDQFIRVSRSPDRTALLQALKAGEDVAGATMSNSLPTLQVRTK